jgi:hypothetical protein
MPICAAVLTLKDASPTRVEEVEYQLRADGRFLVGELQAAHLPVALETESIGEGISTVRNLPDMIDNVSFVHVIQVDFSDVDEFETLSKKKKHHRRVEVSP